MAKYSGSKTTVRAPRGPIVTSSIATTRTFEGDIAYEKDAKSALFSLAVTFMGEGEDGFYEKSSDRHNRFVSLVRQVTQEDPDWVKAFIPFLRNEAYMRTASIVAAVEYVMGKGEGGRQVVNSACSRADEPAEILGYFMAKYGRRIPKPIKRGVADAAVRLYNEYSVMKYDGGSRGIRVADVLNLTHPTAKDTAQGELFTYALDRRHGLLTRANMAFLPQVAGWNDLQAIPESARRAYLRDVGPDGLKAVGMTWERLAGWLPGGMDAEAWEAVIPSMGYMALLRNLRNFEGAGIDAKSVKYVCDFLSDSDQIAKSMQFPYRFLSALKNVNSFNYQAAIEAGLQGSVQNIPRMSGRTLVLVDTSGSMHTGLSRNSQIMLHEAGAVFGAATILRCGEGDLVAFGTQHAKIPVAKGSAILKVAERVQKTNVGYGTNTWQAIQANYDAHDRIIIFTDMQSHYYQDRCTIQAQLKANKTKVYNFDLAGYAQANMELGKDGIYAMAGLSDATFRQIPMLEAGRDANWPF